MRALRGQYFFAFAVMGSVLPYLSVFLRARGLSSSEIGAVTSTTGLAVLLSPVALTLLADAHCQSKHLLAMMFAGGGAALAVLLGAESFWPILLAHGIYALLVMPVIPVQDGLLFHVQAQRRQAGASVPAYHRVRVWGTVGFIVPSVLLYAFLSWGAPISAAVAAGIACCALGALNASALPRTRSKPSPGLASAEVPDEAAPSPPTRSPLPTLAAARAMLEPRVLVFCLAMWLCYTAASAYYTFYPLYLTESVGIEPRWVGLIATIGVALEVFFMLGFGWLTRRLGLRGLMTLGAGATALRLALLAASPTVAVAIGTQVLHGLMVLVIHVAPPIYLNERAEAHYRSSMQGLYAVAVAGSGRIVGNLLAGVLAEGALSTVFATAAVAAAVATGMYAFAFRESPRRAVAGSPS